MTTVTGKLETITGNPSRAAGVWVRATHAGPTTGGVMTEEQEPADYNPTTGVVSFTATAGASGVLVVQLHGRATSYPIIIPDEPTATLREVVENAHHYPPAVVAEGVTSIREARDEALDQVAVAIPAIEGARDEALAAAGRAEAVADSVYWQDDRLSVMGQLGPSLTGPKGDKGDPGDGTGDGAGDVLWSELNPVLDGKAPVSHDHTALQISDATTVGRNVLTAASQAAARQAIGAGTSDLELGTSSSTAAAGDHTHSQYATTAAVEGLEAALDGKASTDHTHPEYAESSRVTALEGSQPIIVSSLPSSPLPGRIYLVTG